MSRIAKLKFRDYVLTFCVLVWTTAVRVGLSTLRFRTVRSLMMVRARLSADRYTVDQIVWAVRAVSRYVPNATCLTQALVAQRFLIRSGHRCRLRLGVSKDAVRGFEAHAWVECGERVVIGESGGESVTSRFTPIAAWDG
jgi:transglutaminase superfamily protein